jgi:hypothetical protein
MFVHKFLYGYAGYVDVPLPNILWGLDKVHTQTATFEGV